MKLALAFTAVLAVSSAAVPVAKSVANSDAAAVILRFENENAPNGAFNYAFETDNGIAQQVQGTPRDFGGNPPNVPVVFQGSYAYRTSSGENVVISYVADENGYQPSGDAIPTPHPIPAAIVRSLEFLAKNAPKK